MIKTTLQIEGMACGMCETHINDAIRRDFAVKKVKSSHQKGTCEIISNEPIDEQKAKQTVQNAGYSVLSVQSEPYVKKFPFFG